MKTIEMRTAVTSRFSMSWDRVPTSRIERVTARQAPDAKPDAAHGAVLFDRLHHVDRAGRLEAAHRRQQGREKSLVEAKGNEGETAHRRPRSCRTRLAGAAQDALEVVAVVAKGGLGGVRLHVDDDIQRLKVESERPALV